MEQVYERDDRLGGMSQQVKNTRASTESHKEQQSPYNAGLQTNLSIGAEWAPTEHYRGANRKCSSAYLA